LGSVRRRAAPHVHRLDRNLQRDDEHPGDVSFVKQAIFVSVGIVLTFVIASVDYHTLSEHIPWFYLSSIAVLIYTPLALVESLAPKAGLIWDR
jgi:cell division protein FtsW (lipid II flippase)